MLYIIYQNNFEQILQDTDFFSLPIIHIQGVLPPELRCGIQRSK